MIPVRPPQQASALAALAKETNLGVEWKGNTTTQPDP